MTMKQIVELLNAVAPYAYLIAGVVIIVYGWLKKYYPKTAEKMQTLDQIAENIYFHQETYTDKSGEEKAIDGLNELMKQAIQAHIHTTEENAAGALQKAYAKYNGGSAASVESGTETPTDIPDAPVEVKVDE